MAFIRFPNSDHQGAESIVKCTNGMYLPLRWNILVLGVTAMTQVLWHTTLCNVSCFPLIIWHCCRGITGLQVQWSWCCSGVEAEVGLKHLLYLMTESVSDTDVLSQCARKHALKTDATMEEGIICSFFFCWAYKSSYLLTSASRATHETPFVSSVHMSWVNQYLQTELFRLTEVTKKMVSGTAGESGDVQAKSAHLFGWCSYVSS